MDERVEEVAAEVTAEVVAEVMHGNGGENGRGGAFGYSPTTGKAYETLQKRNDMPVLTIH